MLLCLCLLLLAWGTDGASGKLKARGVKAAARGACGKVSASDSVSRQSVFRLLPAAATYTHPSNRIETNTQSIDPRKLHHYAQQQQKKAASAAAGGAAASSSSDDDDSDDNDDPDVIPFLASTKGRFKKGADLTSSSELTGFLGRAAKGVGRAFVGTPVFRFMAEVGPFVRSSSIIVGRNGPTPHPTHPSTHTPTNPMNNPPPPSKKQQ